MATIGSVRPVDGTFARTNVAKNYHPLHSYP